MFFLSWFLTGVVLMGCMLGVIVGLISFVAFGQDKKRHIRDVVRGFGKSRRPFQAAPVFREQVKGEWVNVKVSFFPLLRVLRFLLMGILFNITPLLIALLLCPEGKTVQIGYLSIWLVIAIPMPFIFWIAYLRRDIYDFPVFHQILPNGSLRRVRPDSDAKSLSLN